MKNILIILLANISLSIYGQSFTVNGVCLGARDSTPINLYYLILKNGVWTEIADTVYTKYSKFNFQGQVNGLTSATLVINDNTQGIQIYLEPRKIHLSIDEKNPFASEFSGTSVDREYEDLRYSMTHVQKAINTNIDTIQYLFSQMGLHENEQAMKDSLMQRAYYFKAKYIENEKNLDSLRLDFIYTHNSYKIIPDLLYSLSRTETFEINKLKAIYNRLPKENQASLMGQLALKQIHERERLSGMQEIQISDVAPDFLRISMQGDSIRLSDFRNKSYVLLDFWASWCGPCLKSMPEVKNVFKRFGESDLRIIGISSDSERKNWLKAIRQNQIGGWSQVLQKFELDKDSFSKTTDIVDTYHIQAIPTYILIDKKGKVIGKWHHIEEKEMNEIAGLINEK
jgi:peroxiredoxin